MKHYIVIATDLNLGEVTVSALDIVKTLLKEGFWAFSPAAPVKHKLTDDEKIVFYIGGKGRHYFVAHGQVKNTVHMASEKQVKTLEKLGLQFMNMTIEIRNVKWFKEPVELKPLIKQLGFIADKKNYGLSLRLPVREISKRDYELIVKKYERS
jgi:predicted RNA-binding protein